MSTTLLPTRATVSPHLPSGSNSTTALRTRPAVVAEPGVLSESELDRLYAEAALAHPSRTSRYVQACLAVDFRTANEDAFFGPQATLAPPAEPLPRHHAGNVSNGEGGTGGVMILSGP